jgi:dihydroorotate dehydrogenase electron transfer subunit
MRLFMARVTGNEEIMPKTHIITLDAGTNARTATPGRFIHIRCGDATLLRRPMSVYRAEDDTIELMIRNVGEGSGWITRRGIGDELDCLGPLGRGFQLDRNARNLLMVGGGYGVAPLVGLAEQAVAQGMSVTLAVGAATAAYIFPPRLLPDAVEYLVATDDGSAGHAGYVTDLVPERLGWAEAVYACGPVPMMAALARIMRVQAPSKPGQIAMEERMGCAMGVCLGCCIETTKGPLRTCTEGPVFDIKQVIWRNEPTALRAGLAEPVGVARGDR